MFWKIFALLLEFEASSWTRVAVSDAITALLTAGKLLPHDAAAVSNCGFAVLIVAVLLALDGFLLPNLARRSTGIRIVEAA